MGRPNYFIFFVCFVALLLSLIFFNYFSVVLQTRVFAELEVLNHETHKALADSSRVQIVGGQYEEIKTHFKSMLSTSIKQVELVYVDGKKICVSEGDECFNSETKPLLSKCFDISYDNAKVSKAADICFGYQNNTKSEVMKLLSIALRFQIIFIVLLTTFFVLFVNKVIKENRAFIAEQFQSLLGNAYSVRKSAIYLDTESFAEYFKEISLVFSKYKEELKSRLELSATKLISSQVAHDIRSPLASLEMLTDDMSNFPEDKRVVLRSAINRIRDIANSLLQDSKEAFINLSPLEGSITVFSSEITKDVLLLPLMESLVSEKRMQFRKKLGLSINLIRTPSSYGVFSKVQVTEFKRVLSNLIDNAVESIIDSSGSVNISLSVEDFCSAILIEDTGKGICAENLKRLGERGATFNKEGGSGLGLYHAVNTIKSWGGALTVDSKEREGTRIFIKLPLVEPLAWFVPVLKLNEKSKLVIFDDDMSIHEIWKSRMSTMNRADVNLIHLSNSFDLRKYFGNHFDDLENILFLMDFEILSAEETGLDLIIELGLNKYCALVTSRYDDERIQQTCVRLGIKLIPKSMCSLIPIEFSS